MRFEFFAWARIGAAVAHTASVYKTDDPLLMEALDVAIKQGRVVMDGDSIVSIDGEPLKPSEESE